MSYNIIRTNGTNLGTIADGTYNDTATSLTLVGRNYSNYGQIMTNTLVRLIENSSYGISPSNPLSGQLWWDSGNNYLKVYTGNTWKIVSSCTSQASAPVTVTPGDLWWDSDDQQLYVYNGTDPYNVNGWIEVGPGYPVGHKTGAIYETITDNAAATHYVLSIYADGTRTAIISKDALFTPSPALTGFSTIQPGYNLATGFTLWGTANSASYLGAQPAANYFRNNQNNFGSGNLAVGSDAGITIGVGSDLTLSVNGTDAQIINNTNGGNLALYANGTGTLTRYLTITAGGAVEVSANATTTLGVATKGYVDNSFINANLWGISTAITAPAGTSNTMIATTEFVATGLSGIFKYKIYDGAVGTNHMWIDSVNSAANLVVGSSMVLMAQKSGGTATLTLKAGALSDAALIPTQGNLILGAGDSNITGNTWIATTGYARQATKYWDGSFKFVSTGAPSSSDGNNGDFWFQIAS
jgi:hypothetical protein